MEDLINEAGNGSEDLGTSAVIDKPLSIRDSLKAAIDGTESGAPAAGTVERQRDEKNGRFVAKGNEQAATAPQAAAAAPKPSDTPAAANTAPAAQPTDQPAPHRVPPGWAPEAKALFGNLPAEVQAAISKREQEVDNGFRVLQDYKGLEEFTPIVKQAGMTHADVMRKAIDWENALIRDPINTVIHVAKVAGVNLSALVAGQQDQILQRQPEQVQQQPQPQPVNVEATVEQILRKRDTETQVNAFVSDPANKHAEAVLDDMVALISTGRASSLQDAYDAACWMRPDIRQQLISQVAPANTIQDQTSQRAAAADQARRASRSISGSSAPGPTQGAGAGQPTSIRDSLRSALHAASGRV